MDRRASKPEPSAKHRLAGYYAAGQRLAASAAADLNGLLDALGQPKSVNLLLVIRPNIARRLLTSILPAVALATALLALDPVFHLILPLPIHLHHLHRIHPESSFHRWWFSTFTFTTLYAVVWPMGKTPAWMFLNGLAGRRYLRRRIRRIDATILWAVPRVKRSQWTRIKSEARTTLANALESSNDDVVCAVLKAFGAMNDPAVAEQALLILSQPVENGSDCRQIAARIYLERIRQLSAEDSQRLLRPAYFEDSYSTLVRQSREPDSAVGLLHAASLPQQPQPVTNED